MHQDGTRVRCYIFPVKFNSQKGQTSRGMQHERTNRRRASQMFIAENTSYLLAASARESNKANFTPLKWGCLAGVTNWKRRARTSAGSESWMTSPCVSNSGPGKEPVVASRYLRCKLNKTPSDDRTTRSVPLVSGSGQEWVNMCDAKLSDTWFTHILHVFYLAVKIARVPPY